MFGVIVKMVKVRIGQKVTRQAAKTLGLGPVAWLMGLIGGFRTI